MQPSIKHRPSKYTMPVILSYGYIIIIFHDRRTSNIIRPRVEIPGSRIRQPRPREYIIMLYKSGKSTDEREFHFAVTIHYLHDSSQRRLSRFGGHYYIITHLVDQHATSYPARDLNIIFLQ